eukprot:372651-Karenia_brevis.AAC.1
MKVACVGMQGGANGMSVSVCSISASVLACQECFGPPCAGAVEMRDRGAARVKQDLDGHKLRD